LAGSSLVRSPLTLLAKRNERLLDRSRTRLLGGVGVRLLRLRERLLDLVLDLERDLERLSDRDRHLERLVRLVRDLAMLNEKFTLNT
jgi:hypothetical protein